MKEVVIPKHVGVIIGGNREWAKERNLSFEHGLLKGYEILKQCPEWFFEKGVREISFLFFSSNEYDGRENDLNYLMKQTKKFFTENLEDYKNSGYKILFSGEMNDLPGNLADVFQSAMTATKDNNNGVLNFCFNYSGRVEIVEAIKKIIEKKFEINEISEALIKKYLYQNELSYPDLIVGTAGTQKTSGFLLWQSVESEFISMNKYWPDFEKTDIEIILNKYNKIKN